MNNSKKLKALVLSLGLAALMAPATMNAQINRGLLENPYKDNSSKKQKHGMMNYRGDYRSGSSTLGNEAFGAVGSQIDNEPFGAPLGGGIGILLAAGAGYALIQSKKNKQN